MLAPGRLLGMLQVLIVARMTSFVSTASPSARRVVPGRPRDLAELDRVSLKEPLQKEGVTLPAGATGTIVAVWMPGEAYEVEFTNPAAAVVTLRRREVRAMPRR